MAFFIYAGISLDLVGHLLALSFVLSFFFLKLVLFA